MYIYIYIDILIWNTIKMPHMPVYSYAWSRSLCEGRTSFYLGLISRKLWRFLLMFSSGFTSLKVLLLFPLPITFLVSVPSDHVPLYSRQDSLFYHIAYNYSCADWDSLCDYLRDVPWEDIFKISASAAAREFCEWVQLGTDVYIFHRKYQVKLHSYPWFSSAFAATIVQRNCFLDPRLWQEESYELGSVQSFILHPSVWKFSWH